jgi:hypothetical protein
MVGLGGLEPPTSRLSGVHSNQLSYRPIYNEDITFYYYTAIPNIVISLKGGNDNIGDCNIIKLVFYGTDLCVLKQRRPNIIMSLIKVNLKSIKLLLANSFFKRMLRIK